MAYFLSRLNNSGEVVSVSDNFPYEHLFSIYVITPWYDDIENYLSSRKLPPLMTSKEKKIIIKQSARHIWVNGDLFYTGYDLIIRRRVRKDEVLDILKACHDERTTYKILNLGYCWPSLSKTARSI